MKLNYHLDGGTCAEHSITQNVLGLLATKKNVVFPYIWNSIDGPVTIQYCDNCSGIGIEECAHGEYEKHQYCSHNKTIKHD